MSENSSKSLFSPEIPHFYTSLRRVIKILGEEMAHLEKRLESREADTPEARPFVFFTREGIKQIREAEEIFKIVFRNLGEDLRFRSGFETLKTKYTGEPEK